MHCTEAWEDLAWVHKISIGRETLQTDKLSSPGNVLDTAGRLLVSIPLASVGFRLLLLDMRR